MKRQNLIILEILIILVTFNKNGLWIKEKVNSKQRIISAKKPQGFKLINLTIFHLDENQIYLKKFIQKSKYKK